MSEGLTIREALGWAGGEGYVEIDAARAALAALEARLAEALQENGRLAVEAATADQDWKKAEARLAEAERALESIIAIHEGWEHGELDYGGRGDLVKQIARAALLSESERSAKP